MADRTNLPTLYRNALDAMPSDFARDVWLWAAEHRSMDAMLYDADRFAIQAESLVAKIAPMLKAAAKSHGLDNIDPDLVNFILRRHANFQLGGNLSPPYCQQEATHG